jgi:hypothetical protein
MPQFAQVVTDSTTGKQKYRWEGLLEWEYPFDPTKPVIFLAAPPSGVAHANFPFMVKGDPGLGAVFSTTPDVTWLEWNDPTPDSYEIVELAPATTTTRQLLKVVIKQHKGRPGADGASVLNPSSFGTPAYKKMLQINTAATGFELVAQKVGGLHYPAAAASAAPAGSTGGVSLQQITIPANTYGSPFRLEVNGGTVVTASTIDAQVDLVARLNAPDGPVVGRCVGIGGLTDRLTLAGGLDDSALAAGAGTAVSNVTLSPTVSNTVYLRSEKQSGAATYQTSAAATRMQALAVFVP